MVCEGMQRDRDEERERDLRRSFFKYTSVPTNDADEEEHAR